jgi:predicted nucleic acid-binding Zn ribbon protein
MSLSSFHLKGNGWYATDYGGKKAPVAEKKEVKTSETEKSQPPSKTTTTSEE